LHKVHFSASLFKPSVIATIIYFCYDARFDILIKDFFEEIYEIDLNRMRARRPAFQESNKNESDKNESDKGLFPPGTDVMIFFKLLKNGLFTLNTASLCKKLINTLFLCKKRQFFPRKSLKHR
jgi:hypothetical protein